jgi:hypothetical protein
MSNPPTNKFARLTLVVPTVLVLGGWDPVEQRHEPSVETLLSIVEGYAHAIETNNRELALWYVHPHSPQRPAIDAALRDQLASYLERARTSSLKRLRRSDGVISARVDQEIVRVVGLKFTRATRRSTYNFRALGNSWRVWEIDEVPDP